MIRFFTLLLFLLLAFGIYMVYLRNRLNVLEYAMRTARDDILPGLLEKNQHIGGVVAGRSTDLAKKILRSVKKVSAKSDHFKGVIAQNTLEQQFSDLLEESSPRKGSKAYATLLEIASYEQEIASQKRFFNTKVYDYNQQLHTFPSSILAQVQGRKDISFFDLSDDEKGGIQADYRNT